jgi:hypothetical protein
MECCRPGSTRRAEDSAAPSRHDQGVPDLVGDPGQCTRPLAGRALISPAVELRGPPKPLVDGLVRRDTQIGGERTTTGPHLALAPVPDHLRRAHRARPKAGRDSHGLVCRPVFASDANRCQRRRTLPRSVRHVSSTGAWTLMASGASGLVRVVRCQWPSAARCRSPRSDRGFCCGCPSHRLFTYWLPILPGRTGVHRLDRGASCDNRRARANTYRRLWRVEPGPRGPGLRVDDVGTQ